MQREAVIDTAADYERFTTADLKKIRVPDGWRIEIIDGELLVSKNPSWEHQHVCSRVIATLLAWSDRTGRGQPNIAVGVIFAPDDNVIPDVVWASNERLASGLRRGRFRQRGPELLVEVLSPGPANRRRDLELKLDLYSRRGAHEYWICDWEAGTVDVFRRLRTGGPLEHVAKLAGDDALTSPLLPDFRVRVGDLFG